MVNFLIANHLYIFEAKPYVVVIYCYNMYLALNCQYFPRIFASMTPCKIEQ